MLMFNRGKRPKEPSHKRRALITVVRGYPFAVYTPSNGWRFTLSSGPEHLVINGVEMTDDDLRRGWLDPEADERFWWGAYTGLETLVSDTPERTMTRRERILRRLAESYPNPVKLAQIVPGDRRQHVWGLLQEMADSGIVQRVGPPQGYYVLVLPDMNAWLSEPVRSPS